MKGIIQEMKGIILIDPLGLHGVSSLIIIVLHLLSVKIENNTTIEVRFRYFPYMFGIDFCY